jgi:hypothetical protein
MGMRPLRRKRSSPWTLGKSTRTFAVVVRQRKKRRNVGFAIPALTLGSAMVPALRLVLRTQCREARLPAEEFCTVRFARPPVRAQ